MSPTIVHRYSWPMREAIEALLGDAAGDAERWQLRVDGDEVVVDIVAPAPGITPSMADVTNLSDERLKRAGIDWYHVEDGSPHDRYVKQPSSETAKINAPAEPERRGGDLARRASIICGQKGFWSFVRERYGVALADKEAAAAWMYDRFCIQSRVDLDYDAGAASGFRDVEQAYKMWLDGY